MLFLFVHLFSNFLKSIEPFQTHKLYKAGHEIALHSISHISSTEYWKNIKVEDLVKEFQGEKDIIAKFAQINKTDIQGNKGSYDFGKIYLTLTFKTFG